MGEGKRLLTAEELAEALSVSRRTIFNLRAEGMPYIQLGPKAVRYDLEDVVSWLKGKGQKK